MVVTADGTAYETGASVDVFGKRTAKLWTITKEFEVSEQTLSDGGTDETGLDVALDQDGNIWTLTCGKALNIYKNGKFVKALRENISTWDHYISFHGKDMYIISTSIYWGGDLVVYKNDAVLYTLSPESDDSYFHAGGKVQVSKNGDVYFVFSDRNSAYTYKNGNLLWKQAGRNVYSFAVVN